MKKHSKLVILTSLGCFYCFQQRRILRCYRCMFFNLRLEMEAYLRYEKTFGRIVSGCPAAEWEDDEYDPDEV